MNESSRSFECFGGWASVRVMPSAGAAEADAAAALAALRLLWIHGRLTRFSPDSELSRLNADPRLEVPATPLLRRLVWAVRWAGEMSGGLVDATRLDALEEAGYTESLRGAEPPRKRPFSRIDPRPALPDPASRWQLVDVDAAAGTIFRPPGVRVDPGGLAKGLAADLLGEAMRRRPAYVIDCAGDLRVGGSDGRRRPVEVRDPFGGGALHEFLLTDGAVATSGVTARSWLRPDGSLAHHLIDPGRGEPAWTGVAQVTALAPTALEAEVRAKAALLSGPAAARDHLPHGGFMVLADRRAVEVQPVARAAAVAA